MILAAMAFFSSWGRSDAKEVSFQEFKTQLLAKGLVEKLEVSNKALVKVYIRSNSTGRCAAAIKLLLHSQSPPNIETARLCPPSLAAAGEQALLWAGAGCS